MKQRDEKIVIVFSCVLHIQVRPREALACVQVLEPIRERAGVIVVLSAQQARVAPPTAMDREDDVPHARARVHDGQRERRRRRLCARWR